MPESPGSPTDRLHLTLIEKCVAESVCVGRSFAAVQPEGISRACYFQKEEECLIFCGHQSIAQEADNLHGPQRQPSRIKD